MDCLFINVFLSENKKFRLHININPAWSKKTILSHIQKAKYNIPLQLNLVKLKTYGLEVLFSKYRKFIYLK